MLRQSAYAYKPTVLRQPFLYGAGYPDNLNALPFGPNWAFFFDVDGTLADIAATPNDVSIPKSTLKDLTFLHDKTALALISGRNLASIDALTYPFKFAAAGQHGLEIRSMHHAANDSNELEPISPLINEVCEKIETFCAQHPGLLMEKKGLSVAIHYRAAPEHAEIVRFFADAIVADKVGELCRQQGKMVEEIRLCGSDKGTAIAIFMQRPEFQNKIPVFVGDDQTDASAYTMVNQLGGVSIHVGNPSAQAQFVIETPQLLREWIHGIIKSWDRR